MSNSKVDRIAVGVLIGKWCDEFRFLSYSEVYAFVERFYNDLVDEPGFGSITIRAEMAKINEERRIQYDQLEAYKNERR